jgi:Protein of unknown function DUF86
MICFAARWSGSWGSSAKPSPRCAGWTPRSPRASLMLPRIVAFRNILVHGYATVDNRLVWGVVERDLAGLRDALARLLPPA